MPRFTSTWTSKTQIAPTVYEIIIETNDSLASYIPGQYINIDFGNNQYRSYSIAKLQTKENITLITLILDILPDGLASGYFTSKQPPQSLACIGPIGRFNLSISTNKKIFIATNTGIAPIISMISQMTNTEQESIEIIFGVKSIEYDYLSLYLDTNKIKTIVCVSQPIEIKIGQFAGRVTDYYKIHYTEYTGCDFYLCGNPNMVSEMSGLLDSKGISEDRIFTEKFLLKP
jgi:NAD(P)H-flavin reductase